MILVSKNKVYADVRGGSLRTDHQTAPACRLVPWCADSGPWTIGCRCCRRRGSKHKLRSSWVQANLASMHLKTKLT